MDRVKTLKHVAILLGNSSNCSQGVEVSTEKMVDMFFQSAGICIDVCLKKGIQTLTLFLGNCFLSTDVAQKQIFLNQLMHASDEFKQQNISLRIYDNTCDFANNDWSTHKPGFDVGQSRLALFIIINYSGKDDIVQAVKAISCHKEKQSGTPKSSLMINKKILELNLATKELSDLDLLICTTGIKCISDAFLWQSAYSELYFTDSVWWKWTQNDFLQAIDEFSNRQRRFGQTSEQVEANSLC